MGNRHSFGADGTKSALQGQVAPNKSKSRYRRRGRSLDSDCIHVVSR